MVALRQRQWADPFVEAKAAYAAHGAERAFAGQMARALTAPEGLIHKGNGILLFGWWEQEAGGRRQEAASGEAPTFYIARLQGPGFEGCGFVLSLIAEDARRLGHDLDTVRVVWRRDQRGRDQDYGHRWVDCARHFRAQAGRFDLRKEGEQDNG